MQGEPHTLFRRVEEERVRRGVQTGRRLVRRCRGTAGGEQAVCRQMPLLLDVQHTVAGHEGRPVQAEPRVYSVDRRLLERARRGLERQDTVKLLAARGPEPRAHDRQPAFCLCRTGLFQ